MLACGLIIYQEEKETYLTMSCKRNILNMYYLEVFIKLIQLFKDRRWLKNEQASTLFSSVPKIDRPHTALIEFHSFWVINQYGGMRLSWRIKKHFYVLFVIDLSSNRCVNDTEKRFWLLATEKPYLQPIIHSHLSRSVKFLNQHNTTIKAVIQQTILFHNVSE